MLSPGVFFFCQSTPRGGTFFSFSFDGPKEAAYANEYESGRVVTRENIDYPYRNQDHFPPQQIIGDGEFEYFEVVQ